MKLEAVYVNDVAGAREKIFTIIQSNPRDNIIYFDGWRGFGATAVLRSIARTLASMKAPPPALRFGRRIYIDCSRWESKRVLQRKIAEELELDRKAMAMFEKQDEEDDFNAVDQGSRGVIREVSAMIYQTLRESRFMMVFVNGSNDEIDLSEFRIPGYIDSAIIIWIFGRSFVTIHNFSTRNVAEKLRRTDLLIYTSSLTIFHLSDSQLDALFREEAANSIVARYPFMRDIDLTTVIDCCCYRFFLRRSCGSTIGLDREAHAPNLWICDDPWLGVGAHPWSLASRQEKAVLEQAAARPPPQPVGWPPVGAFRKSHLAGAKAVEEPSDKVKPAAGSGETAAASKFVKVNLEGCAVGRKVDLQAHRGYATLSRALQGMFHGFLSDGQWRITGREDDDDDERRQLEPEKKGLKNRKAYILLYEDNEGDRMLVGDVPWELFMASVKRLYIAQDPRKN